jgi:hypothetical protein
METQKSNKQLQIEIRQELAREPSVDSNAIGIMADHGLVFLSGHVLGVTQRRSAEEAALRVDGVRAVIDELKIRPGRWGAHDADLACVVTDSLKQLVGLPDGRVKVIVRDGKVRLKGVVAHSNEKDVIGATVRTAIGRSGAMDNAISIEPGAFPATNPTCTLTMPRLVGRSATMPVQGDDPAPEMGKMIVVGESFTDEGISMRHVHHRDFPEIRGEGETTAQCVIRLAQQLERAREHAREAWQREAIESAIHDVSACHSSLTTETSGAGSTAGPDGVQGQRNQVDQAQGLAIH